MFSTRNMFFINQYLKALDAELCNISEDIQFSNKQIDFFKFCILGILTTGEINWSKFSRLSLGEYSPTALSEMFRNANISWDHLLMASTKALMKAYNIKSGRLVIDDTDKERCKKTPRIFNTGKIYHKSSGGHINGQTIVFLLLVTDKITIPVGFAFYKPSKNKKKTESDDTKTKLQLGEELIKEFKKNFPDFKIKAISADCAYGSGPSVDNISTICGDTPIFTQLKSNQLVSKGKKSKLKSVTEYFKTKKTKSIIALIRGKKKKVEYTTEVVFVKAHKQFRKIVALKYDGETEFRYIITTGLGWRPEDIISTYSERWLIEVFNEDWKQYEGFGGKALQQGESGSVRGVILSLLVDHCLFFHPEQKAQIDHKMPAHTVGSLREVIVAESMLGVFENILNHDNPEQALEQLKASCKAFFTYRSSSKQMCNLPRFKFKPDKSWTKKERKYFQINADLKKCA